MILTTERRGRAHLLTLNRPESRNAISRALAGRLREALRVAEADEELRAVVLAASGEVWSAGGDLEELGALGFGEEGAEAVLDLGAVASEVESCALPVVAAVQGPAIGGGAELLMACDVALIERRAQVRFVHPKMGLVPAWGGATRLVERAGASRAAELLLSARPVTPTEAVEAGIAACVVDDDAAVEAALGWVEGLEGVSREAIVRSKRSLLAVRRARRGEALEAERTVFREAWGSVAHREVFARHGSS